MANNDSLLVTDEEILKELEKLGISDVAQETFYKMKQDILKLVSTEQSGSDKEVLRATSRDSKSEISKRSELDGSIFQYSSTDTDSSTNKTDTDSSTYSYKINWRRKAMAARNLRYDLSSSELYSSLTDGSSAKDFPNGKLPDILENDGANCLRNKIEPSSNKSDDLRSTFKTLPRFDDPLRKNVHTYSNSSVRGLRDIKTPAVQIEIIEDDNGIQPESSLKTTSLLDNYKKRLKNYKLGNSSKQNNSLNDSNHSTTSVDGKLKRKILRHKQGKPVITEMLVDVPIIFSSCYPSSFSSSYTLSTDLSYKSNSSTGSLVAISPDGSTPRSTLSQPTKVRVNRKKKSDPVAMYNYYKKYWDNFKPPGEKNHDRLRWAVRDKMLDYSL